MKKIITALVLSTIMVFPSFVQYNNVQKVEAANTVTKVWTEIDSSSHEPYIYYSKTYFGQIFRGYLSLDKSWSVSGGPIFQRYSGYLYGPTVTSIPTPVQSRQAEVK